MLEHSPYRWLPREGHLAVNQIQVGGRSSEFFTPYLQPDYPTRGTTRDWPGAVDFRGIDREGIKRQHEIRTLEDDTPALFGGGFKLNQNLTRSLFR